MNLFKLFYRRRAEEVVAQVLVDTIINSAEEVAKWTAPELATEADPTLIDAYNPYGDSEKILSGEVEDLFDEYTVNKDKLSQTGRELSGESEII
jgi:hypothetical protein